MKILHGVQQNCFIFSNPGYIAAHYSQIISYYRLYPIFEYIFNVVSSYSKKNVMSMSLILFNRKSILVVETL